MSKHQALRHTMQTFLCAAAVTVPALAGEPEEQIRMLTCVRRLQVPEYSPLARQARQTGTAVTTVTLGQGGMVERVDVAGVKSLLKGDVERAIRESDFSPECRGERLSFLFTFFLRDPPHQFPRPLLAFSPPNHFFISVNVPLINPRAGEARDTHHGGSRIQTGTRGTAGTVPAESRRSRLRAGAAYARTPPALLKSPPPSPPARRTGAGGSRPPLQGDPVGD